MRTYLICLLGKKEWIVGEVLSYTKETQMMLLRLKNGAVVSWVFNPKSKYSRSDYRFATTENDDA